MSDNPIEQAFIDITDAELTPPSWVISEVLPVGLTIMSGPPKKAFKSLQAILYASLCARWPVKATPQWMKPMLTGPSLLLSYEAQAGVVRHIIEKDLQLPISPGYIFVAHNPHEFQLDDDVKANNLVSYMDEKSPILVVMDPFRNMHSGDENDSGNIIRMLSPLVQWAHDEQSAVLLVHHVTKPTAEKDNSSFYAMRGSSALPGLADGLLNIESTKKEGNLIINATFKRGLSYRREIHLGVPGFGWGTNGYEVYDDLTRKVLETYQTGNTTPPGIGATLKRPLQEVNEALACLRRNNAIT